MASTIFRRYDATISRFGARGRPVALRCAFPYGIDAPKFESALRHPVACSGVTFAVPAIASACPAKEQVGIMDATPIIANRRHRLRVI